MKRENKVLKNKLEASNKTIDELKFNLAVFKRKAHIFDTELAEARGTILQMKMKRQMSVRIKLKISISGDKVWHQYFKKTDENRLRKLLLC